MNYGERRKFALEQGQYANDRRLSNLNELDRGEVPGARNEEGEDECSSGSEDFLDKEPTEEELARRQDELKPVQIVQTRREVV